jgi:ABC-type glycerol-3-phosphate transport system permease component
VVVPVQKVLDAVARREAVQESRPMVGSRATIRTRRGLVNSVLLFAVFLTAMPFVYMMMASFKPGSELFSIPVRIFPDSLYLENFSRLVAETNFERWFLNSLFVGLARTTLAVTTSLMAGYAFAKLHFRFRRSLFVLVIATLTLPIYAQIVPLHGMMIRLGWVDSYTALIVPFGAQAIGCFLARQYLLSIPDEILEAASVDGASEWAIFHRIIVPLSGPVVAVLGILFFAASWNDYIWPLVVMQSDAKFTTSLGLPTLLGPFRQEYGLIMAGSLLNTIPMVALFLTVQRRFIEGITRGAVTG